MRFDQINIVVNDMEAAVEFYRRLGFEVADTLPEWQRHHRTITSGDGVDVDLDSREFAASWGGVDEGVVVGLRLDSREAVDERYKELVAAGFTGVQEPYDAFWGSRYAVARDPGGQAVGMMSPLDPDRATAPPEPPS